MLLSRNSPSPMMRFLQSAVFYTSYLLFSLVFIPTALLLGTPIALCLSRRRALRMTRRLMQFYGVVAILLARPWIRCRVENRSGLDPAKGCLFISNHQSIADPYLMGLFPNEFIFVSNHWPFRIPILGAFAKLAGFLNIQGLAPEVFFEKAVHLLADGITIFCFAEGTRTHTGALGPFHTTIFRLAIQTRVPIVPVCIAGLYGIIPRGNVLLNPGNVHIHALPALLPCDFEELTPHQLKQKVRNLIATELAFLEGGAPCC